MTAKTRALSCMVAATASALAGQEPLGPRSFFPPDYQCEFFADLAALRANGIHEALERSVAAGVLTQLERHAMASLEQVERLRLAVRLRVSDEVAGGVQHLRAFVAEGRELEPTNITPKPPYPWGSFDAEELAGHRIHIWVGTEVWKMAFVAPAPKVFVNGDLALIEPILEGTAKGGVPHPDLLSLLAPRAVLAHAAMSRCGLATAAWFKELPAPSDWLDVEDPLEGFCCQLVERDGAIRVELLVRFAKDGPGIGRMEAKARETLELAKTDRRLGALKRIWNEIAITRDGVDLRAQIGLGPPERAAGSLTQLVLPAAMRAMQARAEAVRALELQAQRAEDLRRVVERIQEAKERAQEAQSRPSDKE